MNCFANVTLPRRQAVRLPRIHPCVTSILLLIGAPVGILLTIYTVLLAVMLPVSLCMGWSFISI